MSDQGFDFGALFSDEDAAELAATFGKALADMAEDRMRAQQADVLNDPVLLWRSLLSSACLDEGLSYFWMQDTATTVVMCPGHHPVHVPDGYLDAMQAQGTHPQALACALKAMSIDPRLRGWSDAQEEEEE